MNEMQTAAAEAMPAEAEFVTTEVLANEGNYRVEIEGLEPAIETPQLSPADTGSLLEAATSQTMGELATADIVTFEFDLPELTPNPLELSAPGAKPPAKPAAKATALRLNREASLARNFETGLQRGAA